MSNPCYATQHSDQMICHKCGLIWDMNDPDPPECRRKERSGIRTPAKQPMVEHQTTNQRSTEE